ncbi:hypothetical protein AAFF_G00336830 [Aldrovandia affinis]|uniref:C2H2-type domain-containing protein n=1 Tax=Aldrovandia affinis TaxID=143900 RepID=A0AAD7R652_9TELE|nr:hypothetical protein AAFF_G00336830 [Aldrovandia affinis]
MYSGNSCQSAVLSSLVRSALEATPSLIPFPLDSAPMGLFPSFSMMGPALVSCSVCQLNFNSESQASAHFRGTRHGRKLRSLEPPLARRSGPDAVATETARKSTSPSLLPHRGHRRETEERGRGRRREWRRETEEEKARRLLYCSLCKVAVNSTSQLEAHNSGMKHKTMLEAPQTAHQQPATQRPRSGNPAKPKYSPYSKSCRAPSTLSVRLKPLAAQLLSGFLGGARVPPLSLGSAPAVAASLFQTQALNQALLHSAPGPLRTPHANVLFSPY